MNKFKNMIDTAKELGLLDILFDKPPVFWLWQGVPPDWLGVDGDFCTDGLTFDVYLKENGTWL